MPRRTLPSIALLLAVADAVIGLCRADEAKRRPQPLDCTGPNGVNAAAAREVQRNWATYLGSSATDMIDLGGGAKLGVVLIPAGKFKMGSPAEEQDYVTKTYLGGMRTEHMDRESPQHEVTISRPIYLGAYPVTVGQFRRFVADSGYKTEAESSRRGSLAYDGHQAFTMNKAVTWRSPGFAQTDEHPVTCVTWNDAVKFCEWLSRRDGQPCRLPTEAEWEYSCRAGRPSSEAFGIGDGQSLTSNHANFNGTLPYGGAGKGPYLERTSPVGSYTANNWGLYDMQGNVWQWCGDRYEDQYPSGPVTDPTGWSSKRSLRVYRGGGWMDAAWECRAAYRFRCSEGDRYTVLGFRIARVPSGQ